MVARTLVDRDVEAGRLLLQELDKLGKEEIEISSALWFYFDADDQWLLLLASPMVDLKGPLAVYTLIQQAMKNLPQDLRPEFTDISAVSPSDYRIQAIRTAFKTGAGVGTTRVTRSVVDNLYIEDALIYRSN